MLFVCCSCSWWGPNKVPTTSQKSCSEFLLLTRGGPPVAETPLHAPIKPIRWSGTASLSQGLPSAASRKQHMDSPVLNELTPAPALSWLPPLENQHRLSLFELALLSSALAPPSHNCTHLQLILWVPRGSIPFIHLYTLFCSALLLVKCLFWWMSSESFLCVAFVCLTLTLFLVLVYFHTNTKTKDVLGIKSVSFTDTFILRSAYF